VENRRWLIVAGVGAVAALTGSVVFYATEYQPLGLREVGVVAVLPDGTSDDGAIVGPFKSQSAKEIRVKVRKPGSQLRVEMTLQNTGRFPIIVTGMSPPWSRAAAPMSGLKMASYGLPETLAEPFRETKLKSRQMRRFIMYLSVNDCVLRGTPSYRETAEVMTIFYRFLGISSTATLRLTSRYSLIGAPSCGSAYSPR
jgi:hypothetical protein